MTMDSLKCFLIFYLAFLHFQEQPAGELILLDFERNPQQVMRLSSTTPNETFQIEVSQGSKYKFSLALEYMLATTCEESYPYFVVDTATGFESTCSSRINYKDNNFQNAYLFWTSSKTIQLTSGGTWAPNDEAQFAASVFQEVSSCSGCPNNTFCCEPGPSCKVEPKPHPREPSHSTPSDVNQTALPLSKCIPVALVCNGHPNCGSICNADESPTTCAATGHSLMTVGIYLTAGMAARFINQFICEF